MADNHTLDHFEKNGALIRKIEELEHLSSAPKKVMLFLEDSRKEFLDVIDAWKPAKYEESHYHKLDSYDDYRLIGLNIVNREKEKESFKCPNCREVLDKEEILEYGTSAQIYLVFPTDNEKNYFYMATNESSSELKTDLGFFNAYYPLISRVAFRSKDIKNVLKKLEKQKNVNVRNYVAKRYYGDRTTTERHEPDGISVESAFSRARRNDTWIDSIACEIDDTRIRISRKGLVHYYSGYRYGEINKDILEPLFGASETRFREMGTQELRKDKTLVYETENSVFTQEKAGKELINILSRGSMYEVAKMSPNQTKPELIVKDYKSASSYSINVASNNKILIHPESEVTELSLNNLINKIADKYEGVLRSDESN